MDKICVWSVQGLNSPRKQRVVRDFINQHYVGLVGLLERKVKTADMSSLYQVMFSNWCLTSNSTYHKGGRVIMARKPGVFAVDIKGGASQWIHCHVIPKNGASSFDCIFIYAFNDREQRDDIWADGNC